MTFNKLNLNLFSLLFSSIFAGCTVDLAKDSKANLGEKDSAGDSDSAADTDPEKELLKTGSGTAVQAPPLLVEIQTSRADKSTRIINVNASQAPIGHAVSAWISKNQTCDVKINETSGHLPLILTAPEDGLWFICGGDGFTKRAVPPQLTIDTSPPVIGPVEEQKHYEPFVLELPITELSAVTVLWSIIDGMGKISISDINSSNPTIAATEYGSYRIAATITDEGGRSASIEIPIVWNWCAGNRLSQTPFANSDTLATSASGNPFLICNLAQLNEIRNHLSGFFALADNIDASATKTQGVYTDPDSVPGNGDEYYAGFLPIGETATEFTGTFDGGGYSIKNLYMHELGRSNFGFFGVTLAANISNTFLENVHIIGSAANTGGVAGKMNGGTIHRARVTGIINTGSSTGGLVGELNGGTISESRTNLHITGTWGTAGLVGNTSSGTIERSYSEGTIIDTSSGWVGGLVGNLTGTTLRDSYSFATVSSVGNVRVGGLIGSAYYGTAQRSFSIGSVSYIGTPTLVQGVVGRPYAFSYTGLFWDMEASGFSLPSTVSTGLPTIDMKKAASFVGWDFVNVWIIDEGDSYPRLRWTEN